MAWCESSLTDAPSQQLNLPGEVGQRRLEVVSKRTQELVPRAKRHLGGRKELLAFILRSAPLTDVAYDRQNIAVLVTWQRTKGELDGHASAIGAECDYLEGPRSVIKAPWPVWR